MGQFMLTYGLVGAVAQTMNYYFPNTIDGKPMSECFTPEAIYIKDDYGRRD